MDNSNRSLLLASLAVAAFAGVYILWGPRRRRSRKGHIPGMLNLGKTCFLNSVLQSLASSSTVVKWLGTLYDAYNVHSRNLLTGSGRKDADRNTEKSLLCALFKVLRVLNNQCSGTSDHVENTSAAEVLKALHLHNWVISNDEQDAHEMFHVLTTTLEEEIQHYKLVVSSLADVANLDRECDQPIRGLSKCRSPLADLRQNAFRHAFPFRGMLASQLCCKTCLSKSPIKFDTFDSLSLSIPASSWTNLTLQDCFRYFMMPEQVHDVECDKCSLQQQQASATEQKPTKAKSTFVKQLSIAKLPDVLCIHIQRMAWLNNGVPMKRYEHVAFPEYLDVNEFMYSPRNKESTSESTRLINSLFGGSTTPTRNHRNNGRSVQLSSCISQMGLTENQRGVLPLLTSSMSTEGHLYQLHAVIVHLGDVFSGHFVTYRRGALGSTLQHRNCWYMCSDTVVREVQLGDVLKCNAYMLLYERVRQ